jgi:hypothetical protein
MRIRQERAIWFDESEDAGPCDHATPASNAESFSGMTRSLVSSLLANVKEVLLGVEVFLHVLHFDTTHRGVGGNDARVVHGAPSPIAPQ